MYLKGKKAKKIGGIKWRHGQVQRAQDEEAAPEANGNAMKNG